MKVEIYEGPNGLNVNLTPETVEETAKLLRYANNARAEKPSVYFSFSSDKPYLDIWLTKVKESVQSNRI